MRILLAIDGSPCSNVAVDEVTRRKWPEGSEVKIISAIDIPVVPVAEPWAISPVYIEEIEKTGHDRALAFVEEAQAKLRAGGDKSLKITTAIPTGSPRQVILDEAEDWKADLIVLGSHGYGTWDRILLGSVSNAVATHAKCSVEIVRRRHEHVAA